MPIQFVVASCSTGIRVLSTTVWFVWVLDFFTLLLSMVLLFCVSWECGLVAHRGWHIVACGACEDASRVEVLVPGLALWLE